MLIVVGRYFFKPKRLAFRNDFCLTCNQPRRSARIRTFDVAQIMFIPILPLGFWKRWLCSACGRDPHANTKTRRPFLWVGLVIAILLAALVWVMPIDPDIVAGTWVFRIAMPLCAVLAGERLIRTGHDLTLKQQLALIPPAADVNCPFCSTALIFVSSQCVCPSCGVVRS
jgi:hypothetical protein